MKPSPLSGVMPVLAGLNGTNSSKQGYVAREELIRILSNCGERMSVREVEATLANMGLNQEQIPIDSFLRYMDNILKSASH